MGACKKTPMDAHEDDGRLRKLVDDLPRDSEDDVISNSVSVDDNSGRQRDVDADLEGAEDSPTPKKTQKRGKLKKDMKGKAPVQKRTSMSRVTRSGSSKKPKSK